MIERMGESGPPVSDEDIRDVEARLQVKLPEQYVAFMKRHNGGRPEPDGFQNGEDDIDTLHVFYRIKSKSSALVSRVEDMRELELLPSELIPFATDPFGNEICIAVSGPDIGKIYFWDHDLFCIAENIREPYTEIAESFDAFIDGFGDFED